MYSHAHPRRTCMKEKHLQHKIISSNSVHILDSDKLQIRLCYCWQQITDGLVIISAGMSDLDWNVPCERHNHTLFFNALALGIAVAGGIMFSGCLTIHLFAPFLRTQYVRNTVTDMFQIWTQGSSKVKIAVPSDPSLCCEHYGILNI